MLPLQAQKSPRGRESTGDEVSTKNFVQAKMPRLFFLVKDGVESLFLNFLENVFYLHVNFQTTCLPVTSRNFCVRRYIASEVKKKKEQVQASYQAMVEREVFLVNAALGNARDLSFKDKLIISTAKQVVFELMYEEQEKIAIKGSSQPFYSIFNREGERNLDYPYAASKLTSSKPQEVLHAIKPIHDEFKKALEMEGLSFDKLSESEKQFTCKCQRAAHVALLKSSIPFEDETLYLVGLIAGSPTNEYLKRIEATSLAEKKWEKYSEKWKRAFFAKSGFSIESLTPQEKKLIERMRAVFCRLIYEEQEAHGLPFASLYNAKGVCNDEYAIDILNAKARKADEKPFDEYRHLKNFSDYDVICINAPTTESTDTTGLRREAGSIVKEFCKEVLESIKKEADLAKNKAILPQRKRDSALEEIFEDNAYSTEERLQFIQNQFCESLSTTHYVRGLTQIMMKKMNIAYVPTDPRLVEPSSFEQACTLLETTSQILQSCSPELNKSQTPRSFGVDDAIALQFRTYVDTLKPLYEELEKFGTMCQLYAKKLPKQDLKADTCRPRANSKNARALPMPHFQKVTSRPRSISIASSAQVETREDDTQAQKFDEIGKLAMKAVSLFRSLFYYLSEEVALFGFEKVNLE